MDAVLEMLVGGTGLDIWGFWVLCAVSFLGSFVTAAMGIGGGTLVLATMALYLPPTVLIPVHGIVQLGSNVGRAALMARNVKTAILPAFVLGTAIGAALGGRLAIALPTAVLQAILAAFILYATWAPRFRAANPGKGAFFGVGLGATFATMFVGATGPLVAPFAAAACRERRQVVATHAALMTVQHGLKVVAFGVLGFAFGPYVALLTGLLALGFAGTWTGKHVLQRLPERHFRTGLKAVLTLLAARLAYSAIKGFMT